MVPPDSRTAKAAGTEHHLLSVPDAARHCGIPAKVLKTAAARGQMGDVQLLQLGSRQFVHAAKLFDFLEGRASR
jgi:hypothetical protein